VLGNLTITANEKQSATYHEFVAAGFNDGVAAAVFSADYSYVS